MSDKAEVSGMFPNEPETDDAPKADKKAAKAKAAKPAKKAAKKSSGTSAPQATRTTDKPVKDALAVDTDVVYLGGSRCDWIKKGQRGVVKRYHVNPGHTAAEPSFRYGVNFEVDGKTKSTQLATKYIEKVKGR